MADAAAAEPDDLIGQVVDGRYRVTGLIGAGGMGSVYRVEHVAIGKAMAMKVLHPRLGAKDDAAARFQREALVGGRIGHPNCVAVSDFGHIDDGSFYLVMELLQGESLGDVLDREGRLPWRRALQIARHVLRGLGHAHDHGVVHRDIKPDNIFLARHDDDPEFAKILDFGIAKLVGEGGSTITQAGITVGTPAYLSPEQAFGGELDGRSDLYSLSVVLYEMLAGRTPFSDRDLMAMLTAHAVADVPRFAEVAPEAEIPAAVEALVMGGLAKQPSQRIPTAAEYVARIDDLLTGRVPTAPVVPSGPYPAFSGRYPAQPSREMAAAPLTGSLLIAVRRPGWQRTAMIVGGAILLVGVIAGIATQGGDAPADKKVASGTATARPPARKSESKPAIPPAPPPDAAPAPELAVKIPPLEATPPPEPATAPVDKEAAYKAAVKTLTKGKTCEARKAAIPILVDLGFKRAVAHLKKARYRMRGGVLGIGDSNTNACLKADAEAAIKTLSQAAR